MAGRVGAWYLDGQILLTLGVGATFGRSRKPVSRKRTVREVFARAGAPACTRQSAVGTAVAGACGAGNRHSDFSSLFRGRACGWSCRRSRAPSGCSFSRSRSLHRHCRCSSLRLPSVHDGLRRLDRSTGETHRPATTVADRIAANRQDPVAQALWQAHVERALLSARKFKAGWPSPRLSLRDPMAFRALVAHSCGGEFLCRRWRADKTHCRGIRLARRRRAGEFPHRCLGHAAGLYRTAHR